MQAHQYNADDLKHACLDFICENSPTVMATPGWFVMQQQYPELIMQVILILSGKYDSMKKTIQSVQQ